MKKASLLALGIVLVIAFLWKTYKQDPDSNQSHITGLTMGTITYNVKYLNSERDFKNDIDKILTEFNQSLSTYISDSEISRLNTTGHFDFESRYFLPILKTSREIFLRTDGAFDPSVGPLVQAWGFGPDRQIPEMNQATIDSLKSVIGFSNVKFDDNSVMIPNNFQLDFSAIAKGYAVDLVAEFLQGNDIENYMVEIGGEVRSRGLNEKGGTWTLGIEDPTAPQNDRRLYAVARLKDRALATSGNYRNYYEKDGRIYAHIIDPRTGFNAIHSLLSVSVFAQDCMTADAYATAFMVMGMENSIDLVESENDLDAIFIFQNEQGDLESYISDGVKPFVEIL
ncbi:MAG: FAD:protein FMN transferase [Cyclobacteriaceae bacterium]